MLRTTTTLRHIAHSVASTSAITRSAAPLAGRRFITTTSSTRPKPRSWKNLGARLALAGGVVYWYNTNTLFAEEIAEDLDGVAHTMQHPSSVLPEEVVEELPTLDSYPRTKKVTQTPSLPPSSSNDDVSQTPPPPGSAEGLEAEAAQQGAFNEETGEINWDCPCLGGMADGPCGEDFKAAFSCFVFSTEEPKGVDCIEKFKGMQDCFRRYPEVYGSELEDDAEEEEGVGKKEGAVDSSVGKDEDKDKTSTSRDADISAQATEAKNEQVSPASSHPTEPKSESPLSKASETAATEDLVPKAWHDGTEAGSTKSPHVENEKEY